MIIALSFIAIPVALGRVDGMAGVRATLGTQGGNYLSLFDPKEFSLLTVLLLSINAPLTALAFPHLMSVCAAGQDRMGRAGRLYLRQHPQASLHDRLVRAWFVLAGVPDQRRFGNP